MPFSYLCTIEDSYAVKEDRLKADLSGAGGEAENHEVPRLQRLLKSVPLWDQLKDIGRHGPVVVLVPAVPHSVAIVFAPLFSVMFRCRLPISSTDVNVLHEALQFSVKTRGDHSHSLQSETTNPTNGPEPPVHSAVGDPRENEENDSRSLRRNAKRTDTSVDTVLKTLWTTVVTPLLESGLVGGCKRNANGENTATFVKPVSHIPLRVIAAF